MHKLARFSDTHGGGGLKTPYSVIHVVLPHLETSDGTDFTDDQYLDEAAAAVESLLNADVNASSCDCCGPDFFGGVEDVGAEDVGYYVLESLLNGNALIEVADAGRYRLLTLTEQEA